MGIASIGRNLVIRQLLLTGLVLALGLIAYAELSGVAHLAEAGADAASILAAVHGAVATVVMATGAGCLLVLAVSLPIGHLTIGRPLGLLAVSLERMARGARDTVVPGAERQDEIGTIARAALALRDARATEAGDARQPAAEVHERDARALLTKAEIFSHDLVDTVGRLAAMTRRMTDAAWVMTAAAQSANEGSHQAKTASADAAGDVSTVATASEHLLVSIEEISRQVVQSTEVVRNSVERTVETNAGMNRLAEAAQKVGDVVSLISRIAAQTNLLALNATIEAARAGEAGRGFAVVAQEVKTLATQTAKATQDITGQIAEIQEATGSSVQAIEKIQGKISEVEHISSLIAAAVTEQGLATQAIARNVRSAASGTASLTGHVEKVARSVDETSASAMSLADLAHELDTIANGMTDKVNAFTKGLRAA